MATYVVQNDVRPLYKATQVIWYIFYIIEIVLLFRFLLKLLAANPAVPFTQVVYSLSYPLVAPFLYIVPSPNISGNVIEWSTVLAIFVYSVIAWAIVKLLFMGKPVSHYEAETRLQEEDLA